MNINDFSANNGKLYGNGREVEFNKDGKAELILDGRLNLLNKYDTPDGNSVVTVERASISLDEARALKGAPLPSYTMEISGDKLSISEGVNIPDKDEIKRDIEIGK